MHYNSAIGMLYCSNSERISAKWIVRIFKILDGVIWYLNILIGIILVGLSHALNFRLNFHMGYDVHFN